MNITAMKFQYFNQTQNLYITASGENLIPKFDQVITVGPGEHIHYGENEHGIVSFGLWNDTASKRPGHGGFWSSRPSIVGPLIGKNLIPVAINGVSVAMTEDGLNNILPEEYHIVSKPVGKEIFYEIQRKDGSNELTPYNEIIDGLIPSYKLG